MYDFINEGRKVKRDKTKIIHKTTGGKVEIFFNSSSLWDFKQTLFSRKYYLMLLSLEHQNVAHGEEKVWFT